MNLKDSRTRRAMLAFGASAAVAAGGITVGVSVANAVTPITISPSTTSFTTLDFAGKYGDVPSATIGVSATGAQGAFTYEASATHSCNANGLGAVAVTPTTYCAYSANSNKIDASAYGIKVLDSGTNLTLVLKTAPSASAKLLYAVGAGNGAAITTDVLLTPAWSVLSRNGGATGNLGVDANTGVAADKDLYLLADTPGAYTFAFVDGSSSTDDITMNVLRATGSTGGTAWAPTVSTDQSSYDYGAPVSTTVSLNGLSLSDSRPSSGGLPALGAAIGALTGVKYTTSNTNSTINGTPYCAAGVVGATSLVGLLPPKKTVATDTLGGVLTASAFFNMEAAAWNASCNAITGGAAIVNASPATVNAQSNIGVASAVDIQANNETAGVAADSTNPTTTTAVKVGKQTATYTTTLTASSGSVAGRKVYFTLTPGSVTSALTANGTLVAAGTASVPSYYVATTDSSGVATITVTSPDTGSGHTYTVDAEYNGQVNNTVPGADTNTATYAVPSEKPVFTNATYETTAATSASVTVTGVVRNQFGGDFQPSNYTATLNFAPTGQAAENGKSASVSTSAPYTFSYSYTPALTPTAATQTTVTGTVDGQTIKFGANTDEKIDWSAAGTPVGVTLTGPVTGSTQNLSALGGAPSARSVPVTGTLTATGGATLAYRNVVLTGTPGVYFSNTNGGGANDPLVTSLTVGTQANGQYSAYAYYTKSGFPTITAASADVASVTATSTVTVAQPSTEGYIVTLSPVSAAPGSTVPVTGTVTDAFGNAVKNFSVDVYNSNAGIGSLGTTPVTTDATGTFTTSFTAFSGAGGTGTLTAGVTNPTAADSHWAAAGFAVPATGCTYNSTLSECVKTAALTVAPRAVTLSASSANLLGGGTVTIHGDAPAGAVVKVYKDDVLLGIAQAGSDGTWSKAVSLSRSASFYATIDNDGVLSSTITVQVTSRVSMSLVPGTARVGKDKHHRWIVKPVIRVNVHGAPAAATTATVYEKVGSRWVRIGTVRTAGNGVGASTIVTAKGHHVIMVQYTAPGTATGSATASVVIH